MTANSTETEYAVILLALLLFGGNFKCTIKYKKNVIIIIHPHSEITLPFSFVASCLFLYLYFSKYSLVVCFLCL